MHILYIHQYFATPQGGTGTRSYEFARRWVRAGHRVTMLTSQAQLTVEEMGLTRGAGQTELGRTAIEMPSPRVVRMNMDGIDVLALRVPYHQTMSASARVRAFVRFMMSCIRHVLTLPGVDVVFASSTPMTVGVPALAGWWLRRRPFVFEARDLWPDGAIAFGAVRSKWLAAFLHWLERRIYAGARAVVALAPGPAEEIARRSPAGRRVEVVPNCADTDLFSPEVNGTEIRRTMGWSKRFVCLHAGALGRTNGLDLLIRTADRMREDPRLLIVLLGEGSERARLEAEVRRRGLSNVQFVDRRPKRDMPAIFAAADLCLVTVTPLPIMEHNSANKLFDALAAGKPVLINYGGWQRETLERAGAGIGCTQGDEDGFAARLRELMDDPARLAEMGRAARRLAETEFNRDMLSARVLNLLDEVAA